MFCLEEGTKLGWLIDPEDESVMILKSDKFPEIKSNQETLTVLKDLQESLQLSAEEMFDWLNL
jgi:Uma2 family endonuclease